MFQQCCLGCCSSVRSLPSVHKEAQKCSFLMCLVCTRAVRMLWTRYFAEKHNLHPCKANWKTSNKMFIHLLKEKFKPNGKQLPHHLCCRQWELTNVCCIPITPKPRVGGGKAEADFSKCFSSQNRKRKNDFEAGSTENPVSLVDPAQALFVPFPFLVLCWQLFGIHSTQQQYQKNTLIHSITYKLLYK